jgi:hypothetical protein
VDFYGTKFRSVEGMIAYEEFQQIPITAGIKKGTPQQEAGGR